MMIPQRSPLRLCAVVVLLILSSSVHSAVTQYEGLQTNVETSKLYIVYMGRNVHTSIEATHDSHYNMLLRVFGSVEEAQKRVVHHYKHSFDGFSAMLTDAQAQILRELPEVVTVTESKALKAHTTRSWEYLGLNELTGAWPETSFGEDVIIGVIDSGFWPESSSFSDVGMSPIPARWKGLCEEGEQLDPLVHCNKKVIGARWFIDGFEALSNFNASTDPAIVRSARDTTGHGTHTASTAAGSRVANASFFGLAKGTAVGGAPSARIAVYKVCWTDNTCADADIAAAFDQAHADGVEIISISLGREEPVPFFSDSIAIASYHATLNGILVSNSAGNIRPPSNDLPPSNATASLAPWLLSVAASTMGREFLADIVLGDGTVIQGFAMNTFTVFVEEPKQIVHGGSIPRVGVSSNQSRFCIPGSLDPVLGSGLVIVCERASGVWYPNGTIFEYTVDTAVAEIGGAGVIVVDESFTDPSFKARYEARYDSYLEPIPAAGVTVEAEEIIVAYLMSNAENHTATIKQPATILTGENPIVASFSLRGPNLITPDILKPDLTAPGVSILAAWTQFDVSDTEFKIISGTSMSCPHVTGAAALIKSKHADWSPAAIKSALMTTATPLTTDSVLAWGSGEINITKALDPGLIYDLGAQDYSNFLCNLGYTVSQYQAITGEDMSSCPTTLAPISDFNYPSISVSVDSVVHRTVTNVGSASSTYSVTVFPEIDGLSITVDPPSLDFTLVGEAKSFTVTILIQNQTAVNNYTFLTWADGDHKVTSVVYINANLSA